jgi:hypothetical protein
LNFFVARKVEGDESIVISHIEKIGYQYLKRQFLFDVILVLPLGTIGLYYHPEFKYLYLIKGLRIKAFFKFFKQSFYMPQIREHFRKKLE